jgi:NADH-quinone oxidoreductase subunit J
MGVVDIIFYLLALVILTSTALALTRRNMVHAVLYLVVSFFGSAMLFYLLGAPFLAALEVIIYPGAIMVLFLFIIMMIDIEHAPEQSPTVQHWVPPAILILAFVIVGGWLILGQSAPAGSLSTRVVSPHDFGYYLIEQHWLMVEVISIMLLVALVGALYLGRLHSPSGSRDAEEEG